MTVQEAITVAETVLRGHAAPEGEIDALRLKPATKGDPPGFDAAAVVTDVDRSRTLKRARYFLL